MGIRRIRDKLLRDSLLYLVLLVAILAGGYVAGHSVIWYGTERWYLLFHWMSGNALLVGVVLWAAGEIGILLHYLNRMGKWINQMTESMQLILQEDQTRIRLPGELAEVQLQMNAAKDQIKLSKMQAKEAEQRKNDLVVYLAHDLKTPLTSVMGYLMLLQEEPDLSDKMRQKYLDIAVRKAERLEQLINEFFEITRFNLTTMELEKQSISFVRLLEQTIYEFRPMLQTKGMTCRLEAPPELIILCDADKLQRVVDNLLRNGILYGYENSEILIRVWGEEGKAVLTCTNHGPTIPEDKLGRIFDQFYRLDSARTSSTGGSGLGLAIAREIVRLHGGTISAESRDEVTMFYVELPGAVVRG